MSRFVETIIERNTASVSQASFGTVLILGTTKASAYAEYDADTAVSAISTAFGAGSKEEKMATQVMGGSLKPSKVATLGVSFTDGGAVTTLTDALNTLILTNNDWFYLLCTSQTDPVITALSAWTATQKKIYFVSTLSESNSAVNRDNTVLLVHNDPTKYPAETWVGECAARQPGSFTWAFKNLSGIAPVNFNATKVSTIMAANANTFVREGGVNVTTSGKTTSGEYIDVIQSQYYLEARITEAVWGLLVREGKIPFDSGGIGLVVSAIDSAISGAPAGMIARDEGGNLEYAVEIPSIASISTNDKANRLLPDVKFWVKLGGAIEKVVIRGTLKY